MPAGSGTVLETVGLVEESCFSHTIVSPAREKPLFKLDL